MSRSGSRDAGSAVSAAPPLFRLSPGVFGGRIAGMCAVSLLLIPYLLSCFASPAAAGAGRPLLDRFTEHFAAIRTLQARFSQTVSGPLGEETATGILWLRKPGQMRWDYDPPDSKQFVLSGLQTSFYLPSGRQVIIRELDPGEFHDSPLAFLLGMDRRLSERYSVTTLLESPAQSRYELKSRAGGSQFPVLILVLSEDRGVPLIQELILNEDNGTIHTYRFSRIVTGIRIKDGQFRLNVPPGTEIIRQESP